jgi:predicted dehydrogenase
MKTYRVAILGCGGRGRAAGRAYNAHPRTEIVGLCDLVEERLDALGDWLNVSARFENLDKMIVQTKPDIVAIPTSTELHHELCLRVLEHGVNIDVEKPMCVDLEQADEVMAKAHQKGGRVSVHHQSRPASYMRAVDKAVSEGCIGDLRYIYANGNKAYYGGHELMNIGTHLINNVIKFGGHCRSVTAVGLTDGRRVTVEDVIRIKIAETLHA